MCNYVNMFHVNIGHNLAQSFLTTYYLFLRKQKFFGPKQIFTFFLISVLCSVISDIVCAMAAPMKTTSQTASLTKTPIDTISYYLNFGGTILNFFSTILNFFGTNANFFAINSVSCFFFFFFLFAVLNFFWHKIDFFQH